MADERDDREFETDEIGLGDEEVIGTGEDDEDEELEDVDEAGEDEDVEEE